jgi:hypothetical protein
LYNNLSKQLEAEMLSIREIRKQQIVNEMLLQNNASGTDDNVVCRLNQP